MINQNTLALLINDEVINKVRTELEDLGLKDVHLCSPLGFENRDKLHFVAKCDGGIDIITLCYLERALKKSLNCKLIISAEHSLHPLYKDEILQGAVPYHAAKKQAISTFFMTKIFPLSILEQIKYPNIMRTSRRMTQG